MGDRNSETYLSDLAGDLEEQLRFRTTMTRTEADEPVLVVRNPAASQLNERIQVSGELFVWSWGQAIAPVHERQTALRLIRRVLAAVEG